MATLVYQRVVIPISHGGIVTMLISGTLQWPGRQRFPWTTLGDELHHLLVVQWDPSIHHPITTNRTYMKRFTHVGRQKLGTSWNRMEFSFLINQPLCLVRKSSDPKLNPLWPKWALPEPFCCSRIFQVLGGSHVFFDVSNPTFNFKEYCKIPFFGAAFDSFLVISNPNLLKNWYFCGSKIHCVATISRIDQKTPQLRFGSPKAAIT